MVGKAAQGGVGQRASRRTLPPTLLVVSEKQQLTKTVQLATAYQQLARELASDQIKVVGGYTLGKVIGEGGCDGPPPC